ncbi:MAG: Amidohydrolase [Saliniramus fredricksonii]|uniref:Amidohydrolase n=2 Tax=Saliniramus fredricksonii TaxID=1653334 RepID=A0A0P8A500_9HYPH|nr:MAG: Amidohydrolase [Saliniramus fredricksonii]SCC79719.1 Amidohydrolase [Saliniramus fredricksonii]
MSEGISGSRPFGERYRDATGQQGDAQFPLSAPTGPMFRSRDPENESPRYEHHRRFSPSQLQHLEQMGIPNDGVSTVYFSHGEQGAREAYQFARYISGGPNGAPAILANVRDTGNPEFQGELDRLRREGAATDALTAGLSIGAGGAAASRTGSLQVVSARRSDGGGHTQGNSGPNGGGWSSGPGRPGGGGAPRGPHGGGGTMTATMPETLRGAGAPRAPAANVITPTGGQLGNTAGPQASLVQTQLSPFTNAAAQFALGDQPQRQAETQNPGLIPDGLGPQVATGIGAGRREVQDTTGAGLGAAAQEQLNSGRSGQGPAQGREGFGLADMEGAPQDPVHGPDAVARNEAETERRLAESDAAFRANRAVGQAVNAERSDEVTQRLNNINAGGRSQEHDFVRAGRVVDALPQTLGPEGFAAYEEIMSDPIWRSALEREAHNPRFLDFVHAIIKGDIEPRVATNRLRNDDPDTVGAPPITGLSRGRDWDIPDVERLLRPNEQDAFRRYAEAFPDVAQIVFEAGYDAGAGQMRDAIRALLNGAYGQDVAASLRSGGLAGGRGGPPFNTSPYPGTGGEFPEPENTPDTQQAGRAEERRRIIVPGAANDQKIHLPYATGETDDTAQSAPSIIRTDQPVVAGPDEPQIWTPGSAQPPIRTEEDLQDLARQSRQYREETGRPVGNVITALLNRNCGQLPDTICDIHSHEGPVAPGLEELQNGRVGYGPGFGSYDPRFMGVRPPGLTDEQWMDMTVARLIAQTESMGGGQTVFFPVAPRFRERPEGSDGKRPDGTPDMDYYLSREFIDGNPSAQTILGVLQVNWAEGTVSTNQMINDRYGHPAVMPIQGLPIRDLEELIGRSIPRGIETIEFVSAPAGCQLHFSGTEVDEGLADNLAALIRHENETLGTNIIAEHHVLGLSAGNPREDGSHRNIYLSLEELTKAEKRFGLKPGTLKALWGETNLSKEIVHSLGGQTPLVYNTPEEKANLTRWAQAMGETGMPVIIHCDSGTAAETDRLNTTGSLSALRLPSNNANIESLMEFANSAPDTTIVWAHGGGLGFTVQMPPDHLDQLRKVLENAPNVVIDMSWDAIHPYIAEDPAGWARLIADHPTRFMFGSDTIATTQNPAPNSRLNVAESLRRTGLLDELDRIDPDLKEALFSENFNTHITPGLERATQFRLHPENAEWLENGAEGPPPFIWQRGADGEYLDQMIRNPARGE